MEKAILTETGKTLRDRLLDGGASGTYFKINDYNFYEVKDISRLISLETRHVKTPLKTMDHAYFLTESLNDKEVVWENKESE